jgi:hypothetical protein
MGVFDHERRISELAILAPPVANDDIDYMEHVCRQAATVRFFTTAARGREWLQWMATHGFLRPLLTPDSSLDECSRLLASWLVQHYAIGEPQPLFDLIEEHGGTINNEFWFDLTRTLAVANTRPERVLLAQWVVILIEAANVAWPHRFLDSVLTQCSGLEDAPVALLLWRHLAAPRARLAKSWAALGEESGDDTVRLHVELYSLGDVHDLQESWQAFFLRHIDALHPQVTAMLTSMLHEAHAFQRGSGEGGDYWDGASMMRSAIEPHEQDRSLDAIDVVINAARDLIEWLIANKHETAVGLRSQWLDANVPLIRRLGIHALTTDPKVASEDAIGTILAKGWLYEVGVKHEVFQLLKARYAKATEEVRRRVLAAAEADAVPGDSDDQRRISAYERFNLLLWLTEADPDCMLTAERLRQLKEQHADFSRREYPDLSSWSGEARIVVPQSPISLVDLVARDPNEVAECLTVFERDPNDFEGADRQGLLTTVREAGGEHLKWAITLIQALSRKRLWASDLWAALLEGIGAVEHSREEWQEIVRLLDGIPDIGQSDSRALLGLLLRLVEADVGRLSEEIIVLALGVARRAVGEDSHPDTVFTEGREDWLTLAINHVGGRAALVIIHALSKLRQLGGDSWKGIPAETKRWLGDMARSGSIEARRARTVLASELHFFFSIDKDWTIEVLIPLFSWDRDRTTAELAWSGYLSVGKWNDGILEALLPSLEASLSRIATDLSEVRDEFAVRLAGMALFASVDPWHGGWLTKFVRDSDPLSLESWASAMGREIRRLKADAVVATWKRWMLDYWTERSTGVPRPFTQGELANMLDWVPGLRPVLPEVVELFCRQPVQLPEHSLFLFSLRDNPIPRDLAAPMARLLDHLLRCAKSLGYDCLSAALITRGLHDAGAERSVVRAIVESLASLGCPEAVQLRTDLELGLPA